MGRIIHRGDPNSLIWFVTDKGTESDYEKGVLYSGGTGYILDKMVQEAQLSNPYFFVCTTDNSGSPLSDEDLRQTVVAALDIKHPPLVPVLGDKLTGILCPQTVGKKKPYAVSMDKYAGSILQSPFINYPHYIIPCVEPQFIIQNWAYRDIFVSIDLGHVREEYEYLIKHKTLNPLPERELICEPSYDSLMEFFESLSYSRWLSTDIETIRPVFKSPIFRGHCGYPYTISLADSPNRAVSFCFWDYTDEQRVKIWKDLDLLLRSIPQIGQNYFSFDAHFLEGLGFSPCLTRCHDTMIRHHILWPEFEHSLQFLTKQYTREPYYKDEGKHWSPKYKKQLMRYNCLDTTVTYEVFLGQESDFDDRPHLR